MTQNEAKRKIQELVSKYEQVKLSGRIDKYSEQDTKDSFIRPMFEALGWDFDDREEVSKEEFVNSAGRVDYGIYLNNQPKLFIEAKKLGAAIHKPEFAEQAIRYCFNRVVTWAVLTDFESLKVFNAQNVSENLSNKLYFEIPYTQYVERFDQIWQLSKESFETGLIDKEAMKVGKLQQKITVTEQLAKDLNEIRELLTKSLHQWNEKVTADDLDEGVQKLLDRLIFLRVAEDRGIEEPILKQLVRDFDLRKDNNQHIYQSMITKFRELDEVYNSGLFSQHPFEKWEEYGGATKKAIDILYGKSGYYEYDFKLIPSDVLGQVYESYLGHLLSKSRKGLTLDVSAKKRKEQGIYYTPSYIEDYIVEQALKPVLDNCHSVAELKAIKVLDPACGSGSFLIKAMEMIEKKYVEFGARKGEGIRLQVLLDNIYGVDLDEKAVEIARLNLVINSLETRMKLPGLEQHIKNGNSLISGTDEELKKYFGKNFRDKKPFNWEEEFPEVFNRPNPGFDVIIGNPPYIDSETMSRTMSKDREFMSHNFETAKGNWDIFCVFIGQAIKLCRAGGFHSFILPNKLISANYALSIRKYMAQYNIRFIRDYSAIKVFKVAVYPLIYCVEKTTPNTNTTIEIIKNNISNKQIIENSTILQKGLRDGVWNLDNNLNEGNSDFISLLENNSGNTQLKEIANVLGGATVSEAYAIKEYLVEDVEQYRVVNSGTIDPYTPLWGKKPMRYLGSAFEKPTISENSLNKISISRLNQTKSPKLIMAGMTLRPEFMLDLQGEYYAAKSTTTITGTEYDLKLLLGILNSKLVHLYLKSKFKGNVLQGGYLRLGPPEIKQIPIPVLNQKNKTLTKDIIKFANSITNLKIQLLVSTENSNKWNELKREIEKTEKQVDQLVYKLYGLTEEEIKIVEGGQ